MKHNAGASLLTTNKLGTVSGTDLPYLEVVKAFARLTYESVYVIDYTALTFEYVSDNPLFLCGYTATEVLQMGYSFYFRHVPPEDLAMLAQLNEAGFDFYAQLPQEERKLYSITYDFNLIHKDGRHMLINHKLTPLALTQDGRIWKSMCVVSLSRHQAAGNIFIHKQGSNELWELMAGKKIWQKATKPALTERELEVLRLYAQGFSIEQIAERLFVAPDTVKYYRRKIFERLEVSNVMDALAKAVGDKLL